MNPSPPFWQQKTLAEMTHDEWESLCDGCGKCCLHKLEDEEDSSVYYTAVACKQLDLTQCRCNDYPNRKQLVPECVELTPADVDQFHLQPTEGGSVDLIGPAKAAPTHPKGFCLTYPPCCKSYNFHSEPVFYSHATQFVAWVW